MRRFFLISSFLTLFAIGSSAQWKPAGDKIKTDWASQINPANVLPEYPRPIMERSDWKNLNGLWNYAVINKGEHLPAEFEGQIDVYKRQSHVRIIHTEQDAIFGTGSKHTVRLVHAFCYQIVD